MKTLRDYIDLVDQKFNQALSEKVTLPADGSSPAIQTVNGVTMNAPANAVKTGSGGVLTSSNGAAVTSGTPAPAPDAVAAAKAKLTPSQLKWLGGADATDQYIMARMPKPLPGEAVPGAAPAAAAPAPAAAAPVMTAADQEDADMGAAMTANAAAATQAATQKANGVDDSGNNVTMANGINPETGEPSTPQTAAAPAPAQAAQAAPKPKVMAKSDPAVLKLQQDLIAKGAKIKADGVMGPATQAAQKQFASKPAAPAPAPAPAQAAQAAPKATAMPGVDTLGNTTGAAMEGRKSRNDHKFIDELNAMRSIAGLPTKNKW